VGDAPPRPRCCDGSRRSLAGEGLEVETALLDGEVGQAILDDARRWSADLVVMGRSRRGGSGEPYVGAQARHVLEFAEVAVLVVPGPRSPR
jgi:nucleotide-binding universal stress UspA family protein